VKSAVPEIHFCRSATGARLAFATFGEGPVLLVTPPWISSLEVQFEDPAWMGFYSRLARHHTVLVYDKQGCGLSERERTDFTWERDVQDAEAVVDQLSPDRLSILGASQGGPIAIAYAVRRREQVDNLVLYGTYARGADISRDGGASFVDLVRSNWGLGSRTMAALFLPEDLDDPTALGVVLKWERSAATREMATRLLEALFSWDLSALLSEVKVPTLVLHRRGDKAFHTGLGRDLAAGIPGARFVLLEGGGHLPWYGDGDAVLRPVAEFLGDDVAETLRPDERKAAGTAAGDVAPAGGRPAVASDGFAFQVFHRDLVREHGQLQLDRCRIGLAQLSLSVDSFEATSSGMLALRPGRVDEVRRKLAATVAAARGDRVDLLLLPELAVDLKVDALRADLLALAAETGMTIVPGSHHDVASRRNVATVVGPEGILWEQDKQLPAILQIDGKRLEEAIPAGPKPVLVANTRFGRIAIAICRDFLDLDLRVALRHSTPAVDIVLNPAFTPVTADFQAAHFEARRSIYAYCFFCNVAEFGGSSINTPEKDRTNRTLPVGQEGLLWKDIDLIGLREERQKWAEIRGGPGFIQSTR
jgi:pimeloyl-ACP methyl ester carboxylesterase/predicted amidohydrolase